MMGCLPVHADSLLLPPGSDIQAAINQLTDGDLIQLQTGLYQPTAPLSTAGKSITIRGETDGFGNPTSVISGSGLFRVFECIDGENANTVFENLVIRDGRAEFESDTNSGGGLFCVNSSPTIRNCTFFRNVAEESGGGLYVRSGEPQCFDCRFIENVAGKGAGAYALSIGSTPPWNLLFDGCFFSANEAMDIDEVDFPFGDGGALYIKNTTTLLKDCTFRENRAGQMAGALYTENLTIDLVDCLFESNQSSLGGALHTRGCTLDIESCQFTNNTAGAVYASQSSILTKRSLFLSNRGAENGGAAYHQETTAVYLESDFQNNDALEDGGALYRKDNASSLTLASCNVIGNVAQGQGGGIWGGVLQLAGSVICRNIPNQITGSVVQDLGGNLISDLGPCTPLPGDFDGNFVIDGSDLATLLGNWGACTSANCFADLDTNGIVNGADLTILIGNWGPYGE